MHTNKIHSGAVFPGLPVQSLDGETVDISKPDGDADWMMIVVYRGVHCPLCTMYLNKLEGLIAGLADIGVDVAAVSADSREQLEAHLEKLDVNYPFYYGLTLEQMTALGLYISVPRSEKETDHLFPEPGVFVINADGHLQVVDISNNPFTRPEPEALLSGLGYIRHPENNYPIRGTHQ